MFRHQADRPLRNFMLVLVAALVTVGGIAVHIA
jgi:hypothetical protein